MADLKEAARTLPTTAASVAVARRHVRDTLADWGLPDDSPLPDLLRLVVSELATNVVRHTFDRSPTFTVRMRLERDEDLWLGVSDSYPRWPQRLPAAVAQDHGRGLIIVRHLAVEHGGRTLVTPEPDGGKTVWLRLPWGAGAG